MGKTMRRRWRRRWLAAWTLTPLFAAGCAGKCPSCGGFVAEGPPPPPAHTYVYAEGPVPTESGSVQGEGNFLAVVDVPPSKSLGLLTGRKPKPAEVALVSGSSHLSSTTESCAADVRPAELVSSTPPPAPLVVQHTQPLPKPVETPPALKVEPTWQEIPKIETPQPEATKPGFQLPEEPGPAETVKQTAALPETSETKDETPAPAPSSPVGFGHAEDYSWLSGELQFTRTKGWRLRYAGIDEEDPFGGSVTLLEDSRLEALKDGQMVKVRGRIVNPEGKAIAPPYKIEVVE
jgi:hypothetical protein